MLFNQLIINKENSDLLKHCTSNDMTMKASKSMKSLSSQQNC